MKILKILKILKFLKIRRRQKTEAWRIVQKKWLEIMKMKPRKWKSIRIQKQNQVHLTSGQFQRSFRPGVLGRGRSSTKEWRSKTFLNASGFFFFENDASSFPWFLELMNFITWYLTLMTSRDLCHVIYSWTNWCCFSITWREKLLVMHDVIIDQKINFGFFFQKWRSWIFLK